VGLSCFYHHCTPNSLIFRAGLSDPADPFANGARANSWTPALNESWTWGTDRIFGVNLGGWFILEPCACRLIIASVLWGFFVMFPLSSFLFRDCREHRLAPGVLLQLYFISNFPDSLLCPLCFLFHLGVFRSTAIPFLYLPFLGRTNKDPLAVISPALFQAYPSAADEWTLAALMRADGSLEKTMEMHYDTFIVRLFFCDVFIHDFFLPLYLFISSFLQKKTSTSPPPELTLILFYYFITDGTRPRGDCGGGAQLGEGADSVLGY
jgi:hypothetical protein